VGWDPRGKRVKNEVARQGGSLSLALKSMCSTGKGEFVKKFTGIENFLDSQRERRRLNRRGVGNEG